MASYTSQAWLNDNLFSEDRRATPDWRLALECSLEAASEHSAAELLFAICNSNPDELFCPGEYKDLVSQYRIAGNRSMSVGDAVAVNGKRLYCANFGFSDEPVDILGHPISEVEVDSTGINLS